MNKPWIGVWGLLTAGIILLVAAALPFFEGRQINVAFFTSGMALCVLGAAVARKRRA